MPPTLWTNARILTCGGGVEHALAPGAVQVGTAGGRIIAPVPHLPREGRRAVDRGGRLREILLTLIAAFRAAGAPMALATDCNPGTSPLNPIGMGPGYAACLPEVTAPDARAIGLAPQTGRITPGLSADLALWDAEAPALCAPIFRGEQP